MSVLSQFGPPVPYAALAGSVTNGVYTVGNQTIGGVKTFTSTIVGDISGNAGTANFATSAGSVTNGVYTIGNQTIGGIKTFTSTIVGDISGNAGTVTGGVYTTGNQTIGGTKTFTSTIVGDISGNAGTVTNGVYTTGNQTIGGTKTFSSAIVGDITGNAGSVTNGVYTTGNQTIGGTKTFSSTIVGDISGNAATATTATTATTASSVTNGVYTVGNQTIGGTKTFSVNPILSAGTVNAILTLDGSKQISAVSGLTWDSTKSNLSLGGITVGQGNAPLLNNTAFGLNALLNVTTGGFNIAIGRQALRSLTTGNRNTAMGDAAGDSLASGTDNTLIGVSAGALLSTGSNNTAIGGVSGFYITTGSFNTILGSFDGNQNSLDIRTTSNNIVLSDGAGNPRSYYDGTNNAWVWRTGASERMRLDSSGNVAFSAGTAAAPALTTIGDTDTGVFFPSANTWAVATGGTERMRLTAAGDLGLGTTPGGGMKLDILGGNVNLTNGTYAAYQVVSGTVTGQLAANAVGTVDIRAVSNHALLLYTNNSERMRITSAGNVGIGTTSPGALLHINATSAAMLIARSSAAATPSATGLQLSIDGTTYGKIYATAAGGIGFAGPSSDYLTITSAGNVGIGTTSPTARLHVSGSGSQYVLAQTTDTTGSAIGYVGAQFGASTVLQMRAGLGYTYLLSTGASDPLLFGTNNQERMRIDSSGNVGIGTVSPGALLHLRKDTGAVDIRLQVGATLLGTAYASSSDFTLGSVSAIPLIFLANNGERMRITSAGDVGIGTTAPGYPLTVAANASTQAIRITGRAADDIATFEFTNNTQSTTNAFIQASGTYLLFATGTTERMRIASDGNTAIGTTTTTGVRLTVRGSGTSSATTGLLVEDSAGTDNFAVRDDGAYAFRGGTVGLAQTGYTTFTNLTTDRTCDADTVTVAELADIVGTLIVDLKTKGIIAT